jgi:steroid 5-alpha reductase family enzyme
MKIHAGLFAVFALFFIPINHVQAQVNPGNDPVMWDYVDPTQFWVILIVLVIVGGGFTAYFRRKPAQKKDDA